MQFSGTLSSRLPTARAAVSTLVGNSGDNSVPKHRRKRKERNCASSYYVSVIIFFSFKANGFSAAQNVWLKYGQPYRHTSTTSSPLPPFSGLCCFAAFQHKFEKFPLSVSLWPAMQGRQSVMAPSLAASNPCLLAASPTSSFSLSLLFSPTSSVA